MTGRNLDLLFASRAASEHEELRMFDEPHAAMNDIAGRHVHERQMATNTQSLLVGLVHDCGKKSW